jgi:hypothetical protein
MNLTVNCLPQCKLEKLLCHCFRKKETKRSLSVTVPEHTGIAILTTPRITVSDLVVFEEVAESDIVVFGADDNKDVRLASVQGPHLWRAIANAKNVQLSPGRVKAKPVEKVKVNSVEELAGLTVVEALPDHAVKWLLPVMQDTLRGTYVQLTVLWHGSTLLLRTLPITTASGLVIGGSMIMTPYNPEYQRDIRDLATSGGPPTQIQMHH